MSYILIASMKIHSRSITYKELIYWTGYMSVLPGWQFPGTKRLSKAPWVQVHTTPESYKTEAIKWALQSLNILRDTDPFDL